MKSSDTEFEDHTVKAVEEQEKGYTLTYENGWSFWCDKKPGIVPRVGSTARQYGRGIGCAVRGLDIDGQEVFYRTKEQDEIHHREQTYGKTVEDVLRRWDEGSSVWSVEMGGLGPGYEQCIQVLAMELIRNDRRDVPPLGADWPGWRTWGDATIAKVDKWPGFGLPGAGSNPAALPLSSPTEIDALNFVSRYKHLVAAVIAQAMDEEHRRLQAALKGASRGK